MEAKSEVNKFVYNDMDVRMARMNRVFMIIMSILWVLTIGFFALKGKMKSIAMPVVVIAIIFVVVFEIINLVALKKNKSMVKFRFIILTEFAVILAITGFFSNAEFVFFAMLAVLVAQIPYYDAKSLKRWSLIYVVMYFVIIAFRIATYGPPTDIDGLWRIVCCPAVMFAVYRAGLISQLFYNDSFGFAAEQSDKQKVILEGVVDTSKKVEEKSSMSMEAIEQLVDSSENVANSMKEISSATTNTAASIQEQNSMTQTIQNAIAETGERSSQMVEIATESNRCVQENMKAMKELLDGSNKIAQSNEAVSQSMKRLRDKTHEVEEITSMILKISSQTNLLALNASIESARAGEAGRGFAVVADQIRQLAEQTKQSTESITQIVTELNANADEVVETVKTSIEATTVQNQGIIEATETVKKLNENIAVLIDDIKEVDAQIDDLTESNNHIVDNIASLTSSTEQVTASAAQVLEMAEQNKEYAEMVRTAIDEIADTTEQMKKFID